MVPYALGRPSGVTITHLPCNDCLVFVGTRGETCRYLSHSKGLGVARPLQFEHPGFWLLTGMRRTYASRENARDTTACRACGGLGVRDQRLVRDLMGKKEVEIG